MKSRIYRCNCTGEWSVQNRKTKTKARTVFVNGEWTTELKPERSCNPKGFVTTYCSEDIILNPPIDCLKSFIKDSKLIYDKNRIDFNVKKGKYLYFDQDGACFLLKENNRI